MKKLIPILLCLTLGGCTTGSKTKTNINYYSNVYVAETTPEPMPCESQYEEPQVRRVVYYRPTQDLTICDLSTEIGRKMLRKMRAAYNEN